MAIRAFDPCLSCATHALGKMPLAVELLDAEGSVVDSMVRGSSVSDQPPVLVIAVGNPSRGDDALGSAACGATRGRGVPGVEVITDFQLQVENALDLVGRERVMFVDAGTGTPAPFELRRAAPAASSCTRRMRSRPRRCSRPTRGSLASAAPESWVLCVRGESFELGEALTPTAAGHLEAAWLRLREICTRELSP